MHKESFVEMSKCFDRYVAGTPLAAREQLRVVDIGGTTDPSGYRPIFDALAGSRIEYITTDMAPHPGVTLVVKDPYRLPFPSRSVDLVLCGQVFEHSEYFWLLFAEMMRVLRPEGYAFLIAPSTGRIHRTPVDCYRFHPDAYRALARYVGCECVDAWRLSTEPWHDCVGVFRPKADVAARAFPWWAGGRARAARRDRGRPTALPVRASELALANAHFFARRFAQALSIFREIEPDFAEDPVFLANVCRAASAVQDHETCFRVGLKLAQGFEYKEELLLILGTAAFKLGRYSEAKGEMQNLRQFPDSILTALAWDIAHARFHGNRGEALWCARFAVESIASGKAHRPYAAWTIETVKQTLIEASEDGLLMKLEAALEGKATERA